MTRSKCFISYSHENIDRDTFNFFKNYLKTLAPTCEILTDVDLPLGSDLQAFMDEVKNVECILVFLTPSYKRKLLSRQGGVYREYSIFQSRYEDLRKELQKGKKIGQIPGYFELMPILWSGDHISSVPDEMENIKYFSFVGMRITQNEKDEFIITDHTRRNFLPLIRRIADRLIYINSMKSASFKTIYDDHYDRLFLEVRANWSDPRDQQYNYVETLFVRTIAYKRVEKQIVYFIIGRKGSGKSTVADVLSIRQSERYKGHVKIIADDIDLGQLFGWMNFDQLRADLRDVFDRQTCFEFAWEAFIYLHCIKILVDLDDKNHLTLEQSRFVPLLREFLTKPMPIRQSSLVLASRDERKVFFNYCFGSIAPFIDDIIKNARSDQQQNFYADIARGFSRTQFFGYLFGEEVMNSFNQIIETCRKSFLVTLDGFDTKFDMFRAKKDVEQGVDGLANRALFESDWLYALLHLVLEMKHNPPSKFHRILECCIAVPKDRFHEVLTSERNSFLYHNRYCSLDWSGIELAILLRKRFEELTQYSSSSHAGTKPRAAEDRLSEVLREKLGHIPAELAFDYHGRHYSMPLFFYVLRHTFWRPRDVLLFYAKIISFAEDTRRKGRKVPVEGIQQAVREVTFEVVSSEFLNEFKSTVPDIRNIIGAFERQKQFLSYEVLREIIGDLDFRFATGHMMTDLDEKIEFLYQVGFLGIYASPEMLSRFNARHKHAFYFNEGYTLLRGVQGPRFKEYTFIIHPIFTEYLQIDTKGNELVLELTWDYLHTMESLLPWQFAGVNASSNSS